MAAGDVHLLQSGNHFVRGGAMYLIFPESMIIPEVAARREDNNFEDWLTAAVIENANQEEPNGAVASSRRITDHPSHVGKRVLPLRQEQSNS
jgi:hypothetical protein